MIFYFILPFFSLKLIFNEENFKDPLNIYTESFVDTCPERNGPFLDYGLEHSLINVMIKSIMKSSKGINSEMLKFEINIDNGTIFLLKQYFENNNDKVGLLRFKHILESISLIKSYNNTYYFSTLYSKFIFVFERISMLKKTELAIHLSYFGIISIGFLYIMNLFKYQNPMFIFIFLLILQPVLIEWIRLYQKSIAFKMSKYNKSPPTSCKNIKNLTYTESISLWFSNSFSLKSDECHQYYSDILVDPLMEISVLEALSSALRRFLGNYIVHLTSVINESVVTLVSNLPIQWQFIVFLTTIITVILSICVYSGLELYSPLFGLKFSKGKQLEIQNDTEKELRMIQLIRDSVREEISRNMDETREEIQRILNCSMDKSDFFLNSTKLD